MKTKNENALHILRPLQCEIGMDRNRKRARELELETDREVDVELESHANYANNDDKL